MKAWILAGVLSITALVYLNSMHGEFVFDDLAIVRWIDSGLSPEVSREFGISHRPLTWLSYRMDARWAKHDPFYFHLTNLIVHLVCVALVFGIIGAPHHVAKPKSSGNSSVKHEQWEVFHSRIIPSAFGALAFGIHPLFTSAVSYIDARGTMLAAMFVLGAAFVSLRFRSTYRWPFVALLVAAGVASKEDALMTAPALALVYFVVEGRWKAVAASVAALVAACIAMSVLAPYIGTPLNTSLVVPVEVLRINGGYDGYELGQYFAVVTNSYVWHFLGNLVAPFWLTADPLPNTGWLAALAGLGVLGVMVTLVAAPSLSRPARLGIGALLAAPMLGCYWILLAEPVFAYRNYICGLGVALLMASAFDWMFFELGQRAYPIAGTLLVLMAFGAIQRNEVWRTEVSVWRDAVAKAPTKERPSQNLAAEYMDLRRPDLAEPVLLAILEHHPGFRGAHANLAGIYVERGEFEKGEAHARKGVPLTQAYTHMALSQAKQQQPALSLETAQKALAIEPDHLVALMLKSDALTNLGRKDEAREVQKTIKGFIRSN